MNEFEVITGFVNSGVVHSALLSYPFQLELKGGLFHTFVQLLVSLGVTRPIILKELGVGQLHQCSILQVWGDMVSLMKGVGYGSTLVTIYTLGAFSVTSSLGAFYWSQSVRTPLPWASTDNETLYNCTATNFTNINNTNVNTSTLSESSDVFSDFYYRQVAFPSVINLQDAISPPHLHLLICSACTYLAFIVIQIISMKFKRLHHILTFAICIIPFMIILTLFLGAVLNGASPVIKGWELPPVSIIWDADFWIVSVVQCFMGISLGTGTAIRLSALCGIHCNISRIATFCSLSTIFAQKFVGLFFYTALNHHANQTNTDLDSLYAGGLTQIFQTIPEYLSKLERGSQVLTFLYFTLIVITSAGSMLMLSRGLKRTLMEFIPGLPEVYAIMVVNGCGLVSGIPFITSTNEIHVMKLVLVFLQTIALYIYTPKKFRIDVEFMIRQKLSCFTKMSWIFLVPTVTVVVLAELLITVNFFSYEEKHLPNWASAFGIIIMAMVLLSVLIPGIHDLLQLCRHHGLREGLRKSIISKKSLGPKNEEDKLEWKSERLSVLWRERPMKMNKTGIDLTRCFILKHPYKENTIYGSTTCSTSVPQTRISFASTGDSLGSIPAAFLSTTDLLQQSLGMMPVHLRSE